MTPTPVRKRLILVNGTMGVGKTATYRALTMAPFVVSDRSVASVLRGPLADPDIGTVIVGWVMHRPEIVDRLIAAVDPQGADLHVVTPVCSKAALAAHIGADAGRSPGARRPPADAWRHAVAEAGDQHGSGRGPDRGDGRGVRWVLTHLTGTPARATTASARTSRPRSPA